MPWHLPHEHRQARGRNGRSDVIPAVADWLAAPDGVSGTAGDPAPDRRTTAEPAAGQEMAAGTDTGDFTTGGAFVFSTPTPDAETIFGKGGGLPAIAAAIAGISPSIARARLEIITSTPTR